MHSFLQPVFNCQGTSITKTGAESNHLRLFSPLILAVCSAAWMVDNPLEMGTIPAQLCDARMRLVELIGIEPTTPCLQSRCSPN